jgi:hypothetical protein
MWWNMGATDNAPLRSVVAPISSHASVDKSLRGEKRSCTSGSCLRAKRPLAAFRSFSVSCKRNGAWMHWHLSRWQVVPPLQFLVSATGYLGTRLHTSKHRWDAHASWVSSRRPNLFAWKIFACIELIARKIRNAAPHKPPCLRNQLNYGWWFDLPSNSFSVKQAAKAAIY